jgi:nicotinic acid phosphoribosyltransferase
MKAYPKEVIMRFTMFCKKDVPSGEWLMSNGYRELIATIDAIRDDKNAFQFLMDNKHIELAAFVNAIWEDAKAFKFLIDMKMYDWAACANIINGDEKAIEALKRADKIHFIGLALAIQARIHEDGDKATSPWGVMQNMLNFKKALKKK